MKPGRVYLVGAGPGDAGLITRKALDCLSQADVIVYDKLVGFNFAGCAPDSAEKIYVGKASGSHTLEQGEINRLLVARAKEGKTVVRLKGGDPFVLGRGGEEAEALAASGIPFEVVPGITSAVAVPAYAGIPVTHRGLASSFTVITGHEDPLKEDSSIDWAKLSMGVDTLVFLMGVKNLKAIVEKLVANGRPAGTPVAVIKDGTTPKQRTVTGTLSDIVAVAERNNIEAPAVIVVGEVVRLREKIAWFDSRPLHGKRILVTRARRQASTLVKLLAERGAEPVELPAIDIQAASAEEIDSAISKLGRYDWAVFTSVNGVAAFFQRLGARGMDARAFKNCRIAAIGAPTAEALRERGIIPDVVPDIYTSEALLNLLRQHDIAGKRFLLPRADIADKELSDGLSRLGAEVDEVVAYLTVPARDSLARARKLLASGIEVITFTSSSTVTNLLAGLDGSAIPEGCKIACIGPKTAATAKEAGLNVDILAAEQTITGLVAAIEDYFRKDD